MVDEKIVLYLQYIYKHAILLKGNSSRAVYINIRTYCEAIIRIINWHLDREDKRQNVPNELMVETINITAQSGNNSSLSAQKLEITALSKGNASCIICGESLAGKRKGAKYCSKECNNQSRKQ